MFLSEELGQAVQMECVFDLVRAAGMGSCSRLNTSTLDGEKTKEPSMVLTSSMCSVYCFWDHI
jgi:hypothetical protein